MDEPAQDAEDLFAFLEDLEGRAASLVRRERAEEVRDRSRHAYGEVRLEGRLMASVGREIACTLRGIGVLHGRLDRVGDGWCLVAARRECWYLRWEALVALRGLSVRAVPAQAWRRSDRLGFAAVLRRVGDEGASVVFHLDDGSRREGVVLRVGADFVELVSAERRSGPEDEVELVLTARILAVQC